MTIFWEKNCRDSFFFEILSPSEGIWVLFMDLFKVWMRIRLYRSGQALYGVANALYWKSSERQNSHTWQFWNIKIPKPPYISSLKIIGFLHFLNFLGLSEKNYNPQSLMITLYPTHTKPMSVAMSCLCPSLRLLPTHQAIKSMSRWGWETRCQSLLAVSTSTQRKDSTASGCQ